MKITIKNKQYFINFRPFFFFFRKNWYGKRDGRINKGWEMEGYQLVCTDIGAISIGYWLDTVSKRI